MADQEIIDKSYSATIEKMFAQLFEALLIAEDPARRKEAEDRFQRGVLKAREVRDRAKLLLP